MSHILFESLDQEESFPSHDEPTILQNVWNLLKAELRAVRTEMEATKPLEHRDAILRGKEIALEFAMRAMRDSGFKE